jgi:hypothetical protein
MVGDTPETDVQGAHQAGLRAVWLNRDHRGWPGNLARPDAVIGELGQLLRRLQRLDPQAFDSARNRAGAAETGKLITDVVQLAVHALGVLAAGASHHCVPKGLGLPGRRVSATHNALATKTEPPQVRALAVAHIRWQRTVGQVCPVPEKLGHCRRV